jgi:hypothetical protein
VPLRVENVRAILRSFAPANPPPTGTLYTALQAAVNSGVPQIIAGKFVIEAMAAGVSTRYELPPALSGAQPQDILAELERLTTLCEAAQAANTGANDSVLFLWMLGQLAIVRSYGPDFSQPYIRP